MRRSRTWPERSRPTQLWQMPMRQPNGISTPARSPATRIGSEPSLAASTPLRQSLIAPPQPCVAAFDQGVRLEVLVVQARRVAVGLEAAL